MASSTGWKLLAAIGALMLATNACGDDTSKSNGEGDGDNGDGDGDGDGEKAKPLLEDNVAGIACTGDAACAGTNGKCAKELTGGMLPSLLSGILPGLDVTMTTPGGYCTATCKTNEDCAAGGACFGILPPNPLFGAGAISGECRKKCTANTDCREGYECAEVNGAALASLPGIGAVAGIITGGIPKTCQPTVAPVTIDDDTVGKPCTANTDCGAGTCQGYAAAQDGGAATPGACTADCVKGMDTLCGATQGVCTLIFYGTGGTCAEKCTKAADCKLPNATCTNKICTPGMAPEPEEDAGTEPTGDAGADASAS